VGAVALEHRQGPPSIGVQRSGGARSDGHLRDVAAVLAAQAHGGWASVASAGVRSSPMDACGAWRRSVRTRPAHAGTHEVHISRFAELVREVGCRIPR